MVALDLLVVTTSLDTIRRDLGTSTASLQWIVTAYGVSFAALLLTGAALGDRFGRRRTMSIGLAVFALGSAGAALASEVGVLIACSSPAGCGRSDRAPDRPDDRHVSVRAESPRDGDRRPRRCHRTGGDRRARGRRGGLPLVAVAVDLLDQRAGCAGRDRRRPGRRRGDVRAGQDDRCGRTGARVDGGHCHRLVARPGERRRMGEHRIPRRRR